MIAGRGPTPPEEPKTCTIEVQGIPSEASEEVIRLFFENKKRSGGGEVKNVSLDKEEGTAVITFYNADGMFNIY